MLNGHTYTQDKTFTDKCFRFKKFKFVRETEWYRTIELATVYLFLDIVKKREKCSVNFSNLPSFDGFSEKGIE